MKAKFTESFPNFAANTHKLYMLRHCINIVYQNDCIDVCVCVCVCVCVLVTFDLSSTIG